MTRDDNLKTVLTADTTLMTTLTGGVYTWDETGRNGIGRQSTPNAYGSDGFLRPCCVVKLRSDVPFGGVNDSAPAQSKRGVLELWFYTDGDDGHAALETAEERVWRLLHRKRVTGVGHTERIAVVLNDHDDVLNNAARLMVEYQIIYVQL